MYPYLLKHFALQQHAPVHKITKNNLYPSRTYPYKVSLRRPELYVRDPAFAFARAITITPCRWRLNIKYITKQACVTQEHSINFRIVYGAAASIIQRSSTMCDGGYICHGVCRRRDCATSSTTTPPPFRRRSPSANRRIRFSGDLFWIRFSVTTHTHLLFFIYVHVWRQTHFRLQSANDVVIGRWYYTIYIRVYRFCRNECNFGGLGKNIYVDVHMLWLFYAPHKRSIVICTLRATHLEQNLSMVNMRRISSYCT